jgi:hypothetical protein
LISDVDDSGGIDRDEFNLIASTTCAQIMGRLGIAYLARFLIFPVLSQWLVMNFLPFSTLMPRVAQTVCEQIVSSFLFLVLIPIWFGWVDQQSCVSAERKASKKIEKLKRKEMQRELKRFQGSNSSDDFVVTTTGRTISRTHETKGIDGDAAVTNKDIGDKHDDAEEDGIGGVSEIIVDMGSPRSNASLSDNEHKEKSKPTSMKVADHDTHVPKPIVRNQSFCSTSSSKEGSIDLHDDGNVLETVVNVDEGDDDDDDDDDEDDSMNSSLDEEVYEDSDSEGVYRSDNDDAFVDSASGVFMSIHSRPTPDSSNSDMSNHNNNHNNNNNTNSTDLAASAGTFGVDSTDIVYVDDDQIESSERDYGDEANNGDGEDGDGEDGDGDGDCYEEDDDNQAMRDTLSGDGDCYEEDDDDRAILETLAMKPLFQQDSGDFSEENSSMNDADADDDDHDGIEEDSLGFEATTDDSQEEEEDALTDGGDKAEWEKKRD